METITVLNTDINVTNIEEVAKKLTTENEMSVAICLSLIHI